MTTLREAAQQALAAMDYMLNNGEWYQAQERAEALRAALAEPTVPSDCADSHQPREPLAEWQISDLMANIDPEDVCSWSFRQGVYAAEKHHGVRP